jgi:hypothetical protein
MTWLGTPGSRGSPFIKNVVISASKSLENKIGNALKFMFNAIQPCETDIDNVKNEIWVDLSAVYYKYEDNDQKKAFREVVYEMSEKIKEGKWDSVYKKLYRVEKNSNT